MGLNAKIRAIAIYLFLIGFSVNLYSQGVEKQNVDSTWWEQKTKSIDYSEEQIDLEEYESRDIPTWFNSSFLKYFALFAISAILLFVLYKLFGKGFLVNDIEENEELSHLLSEEDLDDRFYEMDLESMLSKAISKKEWTLAIRIHFLMVIKSLIESKQIRWHKDLTNRQIALQIKQIERRNDFNDLVNHYEKVWYGDVVIESGYYNKVAPLFKNYKVL